MLLLMIFTVLSIFDGNPLRYLEPGAKMPQINENPHFSKIAPMIANCNFDRSNPDNVKYSCK